MAEAGDFIVYRVDKTYSVLKFGTIGKAWDNVW